MRIERSSFGRLSGDDDYDLVFSKQEIEALRRASTICRQAREAAEAFAGPEFVDGDVDYLLAGGEHAFADFVDAGRVNLGERPVE